MTKLDCVLSPSCYRSVMRSKVAILCSCVALYCTPVFAQDEPPAHQEQPESPAHEDPAPTPPEQDSEDDTDALLEAELKALDEEVLQEREPEEQDKDGTDSALPSLREVTVRYRPKDVFRVGGSAQLIDQDTLEAFEYDDPNSVVLQVPGVYVRQEDGYGLRPNIGLRGVSSDRSRKITLMEDGVLFGPAPYSAPAAYYFPLVSRMTGVEVFKGPSAILYGPNTIGGAINFLTREVPDEASGEVDVAYGRFQYRKAHLHYGARNRWGGILFEGLHLGTTGFKDLDAGDSDTGFRRSEFMVKAHVNSSPAGRVYNKLSLKLGFSRERSNETYLGLTDADFDADPYRRYAASQLDRMTWWRTQFVLTHELAVGERFTLETNLYRHDFQRTWLRLDRFEDGTSLLGVLTTPTGTRQQLYEILTGVRNSSAGPSGNDNLFQTNNARDFVSMGLQTKLRGQFDTGDVHHELEFGLRFHVDEIDRYHTLRSLEMRNAQLVWDGVTPDEAPGRLVDRDNRGEAKALASYVAYALEYRGITFTPGLRLEWISTNFTDDTPDNAGVVTRSRITDTQLAVLPGAGVQYEIQQRFALLAGVHRGFSPVAPGGGSEANPEYSVNYELGGRFLDEDSGSHAEVIGFFNDYSNLLGSCGASNCGSSMADRQFNGGDAHVWGLEIGAGHTFELPKAIQLPLRATYTLTHATFRNDFVSDNPIFGSVDAGDRIPYVPTHQAQAQVGFIKGIWSTNLSATYVGKMREGFVGAVELSDTDRYLVLDAVGRVQIFGRLQLYLRLENLTNTRAIVARRPFGARPNRPFSVQVGLKAGL